MHPEALSKELARDPFMAFRLYLSDGRRVEVSNPGLAFVTGTSLYIFEPVRRDTQGQSIINSEPQLISLRHVMSLEPIQRAVA